MKYCGFVRSNRMCQLFSLVFFCFFLKKKKECLEKARQEGIWFLYLIMSILKTSQPPTCCCSWLQKYFLRLRERESFVFPSLSFFLPLLFRPLNCIFLVSVRTRSSWNSSAHWFVHAMCSRLCTIQQISTRSRNLFWQHTPVDSPSREELASSSFLSFFFF